jgi:hypothetical protein
MAQVTRIQRQRIAALMQKEADTNGLLDPAERDELTKHQVLDRISPGAAGGHGKKWAPGELGASIPNSMQRSMTASRSMSPLNGRPSYSKMKGHQLL